MDETVLNEISQLYNFLQNLIIGANMEPITITTVGGACAAAAACWTAGTIALKVAEVVGKGISKLTTTENDDKWVNKWISRPANFMSKWAFKINSLSFFKKNQKPQ